tara:strand:+ start:1110 stop:1277 length:168 start_codon:yes stop_codon:yes gene_type:complete
MTVCLVCGSSDVLIKAWVNPNDDKAEPIPLPWDTDAWCNICDCIVDLKEEEGGKQ